MGRFDKRLFVQFTEFECERQLFIKLAEGDRNLVEPFRHVIPLTRPRTGLKLLQKMGREYEQRTVYRHLINLPNVRYTQGQGTQVVTRTEINSDLLMQYYQELLKNPGERLGLLEFEIPIPNSFHNYIFGMLPEQLSAELVYSKSIRPDILILSNIADSTATVQELLPNGEVKPVSIEELKTRIGISIYDIKITNSESISKKQFIEIIFYAYALSHFLHDNGLLEQYFVKIDRNGILPNVKDFFVHNLDDLLSYVVEFRWEETVRIFEFAIERISKIIQDIPKNLDLYLDVNIQPLCGRCNYLEDCKEVLGMGRGDPDMWDVRLLPYTTRSIAEQLIDKELQTIGDVVQKLNDLPLPTTPNPLYSLRPLLNLKATAIKDNRIVHPQPGEIHSLAIPRYSESSLTFAIEADTINDRAFVVGLRLSMSVIRGSNYEPLFDNWWQIWTDYLNNVDSVNRNRLHNSTMEKLNSHLAENNQIELEDVKTFANALETLWNKPHEEANITVKSNQVTQTRFLYSFVYVNGGITDTDEVELAKELVNTFYYIIILCQFIERFITGIDNYGRQICPTLAIYYWSQEQLNYVQELIERNFEKLVFDRDLRELFLRVIRWLTPKDSVVSDPSQYRKLYDLRTFVETTLGLPAIINYTWHEIAKDHCQTQSNRKFWNSHFNYMDFEVWHEFLSEPNTNRQIVLLKEIRRQLSHKLRTIETLRWHFQNTSRHLISWKAQPVKSTYINRRVLPNTFHDFANLWYMYAQLNASFDDLTATYYRTTFPELSVGKLFAGEVSDLQIHADNSEFYYTFELRGLSSNMKVNEGDYVLLVPFELRDRIGLLWDWQIIIAEMRWDDCDKCYFVRTETKNKDLFHLCEEMNLPEPTEWYLYPFVIDSWTRKLFRSRGSGLLQRFNMGTSFLGQRLSFLLKLNPIMDINLPLNLTFNASEVYLFAPDYLPVSDFNEDLLTLVHPKPDESQEEAIKTAFRSTISLIQGPPGTGKSQTIVSLIDEYLNRAERPVKILITAFSYAALRVLIEKLQNSIDQYGNPTKVAKIQKVYVTSAGQEEYHNEPDVYRPVDNLHQRGQTWVLNGEGNLFTGGRRRLEDHFDQSFIMLANAHQLYRLGERRSDNTFRRFRPDFSFDLIIVDEASQLPTDHFLASLQFLRQIDTTFEIDNDGKASPDRNEMFNILERLKLRSDLPFSELTKIVIVGDHNQLPPVQPLKAPIKLKNVLSSLFCYYIDIHKLEAKQLKINYRSHRDIVKYTERLGFYKDLEPFEETALKCLEIENFQDLSPQWLQDVIDPSKVVLSIIHDNQFELAVSPLEAEIATHLVLTYYKLVDPTTQEQQIDFWQTKIGIVAPHNAQGRLIIRRIYEEITNSNLNVLNEDELMRNLKSTIYSVEKFQGSDRDFIVASIGISSKDQLAAEENFIYELTRFNVLTSRAKHKVVLICSKNFLDYLPRNREVMENAAKIRDYAMNYCNMNAEILVTNEDNEQQIVRLRWKN